MARPIQNTAAVRPVAVPAWNQLQAALAVSAPACADDARYIADALTPADKNELAEICAACPILIACAAYAATEQPDGGFWPGQQLTITRRGAIWRGHDGAPARAITSRKTANP